MATRRHASRRLLGLGLLMAATILGAGCNALADSRLPQTTVFPFSDWAGQMYGLYNLIFIMAAIVFFGVEGFFLYAIVRFRRRPDQPPAQPDARQYDPGDRLDHHSSDRPADHRRAHHQHDLRFGYATRSRGFT